MIRNMFYFYNINQIGGVENFFYELAKKYHEWDIVVYYTTGDAKQIERLQRYIKIKKYKKGEVIECQKAFFNYHANIIDNVKAKEYYMIIHADYKMQNIQPLIYPQITKYIGVSQAACDSFTALTGKECILCYNPITLDPPIKKLHLVSATRLTVEKGKDRILKLAQALDKANIPYEWDIYTNDRYPIDHPHIHYKEPTLEINGILKDADYVVQLSDSESYCYTMVEALMLGTPVIVCPWPCIKELGVNSSHGFILPFNMNDIPVQDIYNKEFNFTYEPPKDCWDQILEKGDSQYWEDKKYLFQVSALGTYKDENLKDGQLGYIPEIGETWYVTKNRLDILLGDNNNRKVFVKLLGKKKKEDLDKIKNI